MDDIVIIGGGIGASGIVTIASKGDISMSGNGIHQCTDVNLETTEGSVVIIGAGIGGALGAIFGYFGGEKLNELYVTSASFGMSKSELKEAPLSGSLFKINTSYKGIKSNIANFNNL